MDQKSVGKSGSDAVIELLETTIAEIKAMPEDERPNRCVIVGVVDKAKTIQYDVTAYPFGRIDTIRDLEMAKLQVYGSMLTETRPQEEEIVLNGARFNN